MDVTTLMIDLLVVLTAGLVSGLICRRFGVSLLVGYLLVGAVIGEGGLGWVSQHDRELESLARAGALLLLFSVGIEFSWNELVRLRRYLVIGGTVQMALVAAVTLMTLRLLGTDWRPAVLLAAAASLSSTVLVFKALSEYGQTSSPHGRRAIGILLFQDIALVPLMLMVPLLTGQGAAPGAWQILLLAGKSLVFVAAVVVFRTAVSGAFVLLLASLRSVELVVLFALATLGGACLGAYALDLPPAIGALAAGLMLSGNRLSRQIDTLILPYRESFAAVFFVSLGTLLHPGDLLDQPLLVAGGFAGLLILKTAAAAVALRLVGLSWRAAAGMGLGLSQLGEFSFLLIAEALRRGAISAADYQRMLLIALGTLIATPELLKLGLRWANPLAEDLVDTSEPEDSGPPIQKAVVVGIGPIGRQIVSRLELMGVDVCAVDLSPINLYAFSQLGFPTVSGDARDPEVLRRAGATHCRLAVVSVPEDGTANQIVRALRELNPSMAVVVRCRYVESMAAAKKAGADEVISEEGEAGGALLQMCVRRVERAGRAKKT